MSTQPQRQRLSVDPDLPPEAPDGPVPVTRPGPALSASHSVRAALRGRVDIVAVIAVGGALGSGAHYGIAQWLPHDPRHLPWSTVTVNVVGSLLLGALMVLVLDVWPPNRYLRPFLGVGVLGGFTTFSTYMVDTWSLLRDGQGALAAGYLVGTLVVGLVAVWVGITATRAAVRVVQRRHHRAHDRRTPHRRREAAVTAACSGTTDLSGRARAGAPQTPTRSTR